MAQTSSITPDDAENAKEPEETSESGLAVCGGHCTQDQAIVGQ